MDWSTMLAAKKLVDGGKKCARLFAAAVDAYFARCAWPSGFPVPRGGGPAGGPLHALRLPPLGSSRGGSDLEEFLLLLASWLRRSWSSSDGVAGAFFAPFPHCCQISKKTCLKSSVSVQIESLISKMTSKNEEFVLLQWNSTQRSGATFFLLSCF